jgi:hypothetical protein
VSGWAEFPAGETLLADDLDTYLTRYGQVTTVRRAVFCACVDPQTRRARAGHAECGGWGFLFPEALQVTPRMQWVGMNARKDQRDSGIVEPGDYKITWPSSQALAVGDLVIHPTEEGVTFDTLVVGQTDQDGGSLERLRYRFILAVEYVNSTDPDTGETIVHVEGEDFDLDGQRIVWTDDGNAPAEGQPYQVRYRHRAEYLIGPRAPQRRHDGANLLPWTAPVTRYDPMTRAEGQGLGEGSA